MHGFELNVRQCGFHERRRGVRTIAQKAFEILQAVRQLIGRRRYERSVARPRTADPSSVGRLLAPLCVSMFPCQSRRVGRPRGCSGRVEVDVLSSPPNRVRVG
jgi:hypothetical protein